MDTADDASDELVCRVGAGVGEKPPEARRGKHVAVDVACLDQAVRDEYDRVTDRQRTVGAIDGNIGVDSEQERPGVAEAGHRPV